MLAGAQLVKFLELERGEGTLLIYEFDFSFLDDIWRSIIVPKYFKALFRCQVYVHLKFQLKVPSNYECGIVFFNKNDDNQILIASQSDIIDSVAFIFILNESDLIFAYWIVNQFEPHFEIVYCKIVP